ncbi:uncharacterized protein LOC111984227 isoform X1 [Quercus suber]|uniref:uncharacterized protein LOC111984227 isoform X1 n=1 Tax=Quercus suber TaxID=58331 RepID=UPI0032E02A44
MGGLIYSVQWLTLDGIQNFWGVNEESRNRVPVVGTVPLNLAEYASSADGKEIQINLSVKVPVETSECSPSLSLSLSVLELISAQELSDAVQRSIVCLPLSPFYAEAHSSEKDEFSALKAGLRKVKLFTDYVSAGRAKKASREEEGSDGRCSERSADAEYNYPVDTDSHDDGDAEGQSEEIKDDCSIRQPFSYETLASANCAGGIVSFNMINNGQDECLIYYSNRKLTVGCYDIENAHALTSEQILRSSSKRNILSWRKRKLSFRSTKAKAGEPLLKKHYGEEGGDDIDHDRRQLSSSDDSSFGWQKTEDGFSTDGSSISEFGDDKFAVGSWESKEVTSRDRQLKLQTQVFFASIDQRSERAAGESACTALVAVIADWLHSNQDEMPIKSEFDSLIRDGSLEWRNLCENEVFIEQFPDKHFDLETILQAKIRPLSVVPEKSFIGFFHPDGLEEGGFDFLHGAMSIDSIWDEISLAASNCPSNGDPLVYIVCWNDHFFVLKVEQNAYYIIDTLGERLYEGCNQAYVLKFDKDTIIVRLPSESQESDGKPASDSCKETSTEGTMVLQSNDSEDSVREDEIVCRGKESCKEYIKSFLAAIPIRELEADIKKGLIKSAPLHHRLQVEFHYTRSCSQRLNLQW